MENLVMTVDFWKNKKVLVTGHTGFKGSWLTIWLKKLGAEVIGFSKSIPTNPNLFEIGNVENGIISIFGDVRDHERLKQVIIKHKPEIIFHLAAQSLVIKSYEDPIETYSTNIMGTVNLLDIIKENRESKVIINVTSDKCYENKETLEGYTENDPMGGYDPYSSSKGCAELITSSFRDSFFNSKDSRNNVALASVRAGNVIGGGDWAENRLIPDIIKGISNNNSVKIRNPSSLRPWQHVLDPLNGYMLLAEKMWDDKNKYAEGWNFGPDKSEIKPVSWIIERFDEMWKTQINWEIEKINLHEARHLILDCHKAKTKLGWQTKLNIEQALKWTIDWYKKNLDKTDMRKFTEEQITKFSDL
jgi:CDP-glucose 4,6-dehydratase